MSLVSPTVFMLRGGLKPGFPPAPTGSEGETMQPLVPSMLAACSGRGRGGGGGVDGTVHPIMDLHYPYTCCVFS